MSSAQMIDALRLISGGHITAFFLVLARITPLFVVAPVFSSKMLIPQVRAILAVALTLGMTMVAGHGQNVPTGVLPVIGLIVANMIVGFALAFAMACVFGAIQGAGALADGLSGFSFGATIDPVYGNQGGSLTTFYSLVGMALFLAVGGDAWTLRGLAATFHAVPLASPLSMTEMHGMINGSIAMVGVVFLGSVEVVAPVMLAVVIADLAFGLVSRVAPQLNVFAVGLPVKVGVALLVVGASLPFLAGWMSNQLQDAVTTVMQTI